MNCCRHLVLVFSRFSIFALSIFIFINSVVAQSKNSEKKASNQLKTNKEVLYYSGRLKITMKNRYDQRSMFFSIELPDLPANAGLRLNQEYSNPGFEYRRDQTLYGKWTNGQLFESGVDSIETGFIRLQTLDLNDSQILMFGGAPIFFDFHRMDKIKSRSYKFINCEWLVVSATSPQIDNDGPVVSKKSPDCSPSICTNKNFKQPRDDWQRIIECSEGQKPPDVEIYNEQIRDSNVKQEINRSLDYDSSSDLGFYCGISMEEVNGRYCRVKNQGRYLRVPEGTFLKYSKDLLHTSCGFYFFDLYFPTTASVNYSKNTIRHENKEFSYEELKADNFRYSLAKKGLDICTMDKIIIHKQGIYEYPNTKKNLINGLQIPKNSWIIANEDSVLVVKPSLDVDFGKFTLVADHNIAFNQGKIIKARLRSKTKTEYPWKGEFTLIFENELPKIVIPTSDFYYNSKLFKAKLPFRITKNFKIIPKIERAELFGVATAKFANKIEVKLKDGSAPPVLSFVDKHGNVSYANLLYTMDLSEEYCVNNESFLGYYEATDIESEISDHSLTFSGVIEKIDILPVNFEKIDRGQLPEKLQSFKAAKPEKFFLDRISGIYALGQTDIGKYAYGLELFTISKKFIYGVSDPKQFSKFKYLDTEYIWMLTGNREYRNIYTLSKKHRAGWVGRIRFTYWSYCLC